MDILLDVARPVILLKAVLKLGGPRLEECLLGAKSSIDVILSTCWHFLPQFTEPERSMLGDFFRRGRLWLVVGIVQSERGRLRSVHRKN